MNTILEISPDITEGRIRVKVQGITHAYPTFEAGLTLEELQIKVDEWVITQSEIDSINNGTATQEIIDKYAPKPPFNPDKAIAREAQVFPIDRIIALAPFTYTINEMIRYETWTQLKQMIGGLMQAGVATLGDYAIFNSVLNEQNIDLDDY